MRKINMATCPQNKNAVCQCKDGAPGATGPAGITPEGLDGLVHIVETLPIDPNPGELYFVTGTNQIYIGDELAYPNE
jgi:hypothetical protein